MGDFNPIEFLELVKIFADFEIIITQEERLGNEIKDQTGIFLAL